MSIYLELPLLAVVVVYIVSLSGWTETWLGWLSRFTARHGYGPVRSLRPFSCSQCMTWWCCLAWCLVRGQFTLPLIAYCALLAFNSLTVENLCISIREGLLKVLRIFDEWIARD